MTTITESDGKTDVSTLPLLGAAIPSSNFSARRDWLMAGRDLELQDPVSHLVLDGDWKEHAASIKAQLEGFSGRIGIHGPFWGLTLMASDPAVRAVTVARLTRGLEFAAELGATHMVVHSPFDFFGHPLVVHTQVTGLDDQLEPALCAGRRRHAARSARAASLRRAAAAAPSPLGVVRARALFLRRRAAVDALCRSTRRGLGSSGWAISDLIVRRRIICSTSRRTPSPTARCSGRGRGCVWRSPIPRGWFR